MRAQTCGHCEGAMATEAPIRRPCQEKKVSLCKTIFLFAGYSLGPACIRYDLSACALLFFLFWLRPSAQPPDPHQAPIGIKASPYPSESKLAPGVGRLTPGKSSCPRKTSVPCHVQLVVLNPFGSYGPASQGSWQRQIREKIVRPG